MSLDTITYSASPDGQILKTVTSVNVISRTSGDLERELDALRAQLADVQAGVTPPENQDEVDALVANYQSQIAFLESRINEG